ncbi:hypothetical protein [Methanobacterium sp.]|uniref:hypothetical protein n=1 Tax=Methanobacterium sp. TaxID=2164 RepID=UPI0031586710
MAAAANDLYNLMMSNGSFKIVDVATLGDGILPVEKLGQFIRVVRENSPVLGEASYKKINGSSLAISRVDMANGILTPGRDASGAKRAVPDADQASADVHTNSLVPKELIAELIIDYDTLDFNLEQDAFETTLMELFGSAAHEDLERYFWFADSSITWGAESTKAQKLLSINDGWLKTAGNKIYGLPTDGQTNNDFDPNPEQDMWPIPLFKALYNAVPNKYIAGKQKRQNFRLYVTSEVEEAYSDIVAARPTLAGDNALLGKDVLTWKSIPVVDIASFEDETYTDLVGTPAVLTKPANMYWGTKRDIMVENQKIIKMRQLDNVLSMSGDCTYEDENATAVAYLDKEKPAS